MSTPLAGPELKPQSGTVKRLVMFLHGVGADGNDMLSLAPLLDLPDTQFFSPNAPFAFDMAAVLARARETSTLASPPTCGGDRAW